MFLLKLFPEAFVPNPEEIKKNKRELAKIISLDAGKPIRQSIIEVDRTITTFKLSAFYARELRGETIPSERLIFTKREPVGVVGAITPFNFPLNLVAHKVGPAFAGGNTVVLHPSSKASLIAIELAKIIERVLKSMDIPLGVFNPRNKKGYTLVIAAALIVLMWITISFFTSLGKSGLLPPLYAAFAPEFMFLSIGLILLSRMET